MPLISVFMVLLLIAFGLWLINTYLAKYLHRKILINVVVIVVCILWVLRLADLLDLRFHRVG